MNRTVLFVGRPLVPEVTFFFLYMYDKLAPVRGCCVSVSGFNFSDSVDYKVYSISETSYLTVQLKMCWNHTCL